MEAKLASEASRLLAYERNPGLPKLPQTEHGGSSLSEPFPNVKMEPNLRCTNSGARETQLQATHAHCSHYCPCLQLDVPYCTLLTCMTLHHTTFSAILLVIADLTVGNADLQCIIDKKKQNTAVLASRARPKKD
jgi:hypothetical protein